MGSHGPGPTVAVSHNSGDSVLHEFSITVSLKSGHSGVSVTQSVSLQRGKAGRRSSYICSSGSSSPGLEHRLQQ